LDTAQAHSLVLSEAGVLYDTKKGQALPAGEQPMTKLSATQLADIAEIPVDQVVPDYVARYWDMMALAKNKLCQVISEAALIKDKPGFEVGLLTRGSITTDAYINPQHEVLMVMRGHWHLTWQDNELVLNPGDTRLIPPNLGHASEVCVTGEASLLRISGTGDTAGLTWQDNEHIMSVSALVLLPGMMCDARMYTSQIEALKDIAECQVGYIGGVDNMANIARQVLDQAPENFALVGLSMGGIVAMEIVRQAPERVTRLALMDTNPKAEIDEVKAAREPQIEAAQAGQLEQLLREVMVPRYFTSHQPHLNWMTCVLIWH
jgi:uncharacterized protein YjlB